MVAYPHPNPSPNRKDLDLTLIMSPETCLIGNAYKGSLEFRVPYSRVSQAPAEPVC